jgi:hypothetical protein
MAQHASPASGEELLRKQLLFRRRALSNNPWARISQVAVVVGIKRAPRVLSEEEAPAADEFRKLYDAGQRGSGDMAKQALRVIGCDYNSTDKASKRMQRILDDAGEGGLWRASKVKCGRPKKR